LAFGAVIRHVDRGDGWCSAGGEGARLAGRWQVAGVGVRRVVRERCGVAWRLHAAGGPR
jgi:hypothetical protein